MQGSTINVVTGSTGFLGRYLVRQLVAQNETVWLIVRPSETQTPTERIRTIFAEELQTYPHLIRIFQGDVKNVNLGLSEDVLEEMGAATLFVWHLAANLSFSPKQKEQVFQTNVDGTRNVVSFANNNAKRLYHISTAFVCGDTKQVMPEDTTYVGQEFHNHYEYSKSQAEDHVRTACTVPFTIFRPSIILGDAYEGKADGCTFGYYRFAYMFYLLKHWITGCFSGTPRLSTRILTLFGTSVHKETKQVHAPWLILPYPKNTTVDIVPVDYVIEAMLTVHNSPELQNKTIHLTHDTPPQFSFLLESLLTDLNFTHVHYVGVSTRLFSVMLRCAYFVGYPLRKYIKSVFWYIPYFTRSYSFAHHNHKQYNVPGAPILTRSYTKKVNEYARSSIFERIENHSL